MEATFRPLTWRKATPPSATVEKSLACADCRTNRQIFSHFACCETFYRFFPRFLSCFFYSRFSSVPSFPNSKSTLKMVRELSFTLEFWCSICVVFFRLAEAKQARILERRKTRPSRGPLVLAYRYCMTIFLIVKIVSVAENTGNSEVGIFLCYILGLNMGCLKAIALLGNYCAVLTTLMTASEIHTLIFLRFWNVLSHNIS